MKHYRTLNGRGFVVSVTGFRQSLCKYPNKCSPDKMQYSRSSSSLAFSAWKRCFTMNFIPDTVFSKVSWGQRCLQINVALRTSTSVIITSEASHSCESYHTFNLLHEVSALYFLSSHAQAVHNSLQLLSKNHSEWSCKKSSEKMPS